MIKGTIFSLMLSEEGGSLTCTRGGPQVRALLGMDPGGQLPFSLGEYAPELAARFGLLLQRLEGDPAALEELCSVPLDGRPTLLEVRLSRMGGALLGTFRVHAGMRRFMELSVDGLVIANSAGYFVDVSAYFAGTLGYSREELCSQPFISFVHPEDLASTQGMFEQMLSRGDAAIGFINRYRTKTGNYRWISWHCSAPDQSGMLFAVARDISEERAFANLRLVLERALRNIRSGVVLTDRQARVAWVNRRLSEMTGYSQQELVGERLGPKLQGADTDRSEVARVRECIRRGEPFSTLLLNYHKSGRPYWVEIEAEPLEFEGALHFLAIEQDVTESVEARMALAKSEQRLRQALQGSRDAIYFLEAARDGAGEIVDFVFADVNDAAERELSMTRAQLLGSRMCELFPNYRATGFFERYKAVALTGTPHESEYELAANRATSGFYRQCVARLHDGVVIFNHNLSEVKSRELERQELLEALRQAQKLEAMGQLASAVAHDFNNSLAIVMGTADVLEPHVASDHDAQAMLSDMRAAAQRARGFVHRLLDFARPQVVHKELVDLSTFVAELCRGMQRVLAPQIKLTVEVESGIIVQAAASQLEQILMNVLSNAREAILEHGEISVRVHRVGGAHDRSVLIEVSDTGTGMSADVLARFTDPLFTTKAGSGGYGLGMATALGTLSSLGGRLHPTSEPGIGTTIAITLPVVERLESQGLVQPPAGPVNHARVLLVDDEPYVGRLLSRAMSRHGFEVCLANSGAEALEWARAQSSPPDVAVLDYAMPEMHGLDVAHGLRARWPRLPVLIVTGGGIAASRMQSLSIDGVMFKPFTSGELVERVERILQRDASAH